MRHPAGAVRLFDGAARGQGLAAIEDADVVEAEKAALENVVAFGVFAVHPPGEVQQQLVEDALEECRDRPCRVASCRSCKRAMPPRRAPADSRRRRPIRKREAGRWDACTIRAAVRIELLLGEIRSRRAQAGRSETPDPTPRTTGTPTCRASEMTSAL